MSGVLRGFPSAEYDLYTSTKTLVWPCPSEKLLIYELETYTVPNTCYVTYGWTLVSSYLLLVPGSQFMVHGSWLLVICKFEIRNCGRLWFCDEPDNV
jgi:hypothetical protein